MRGWQIGEHLVMAAHVFPLTVKLMLEKEGHYAQTDENRAACLATDLLLVETQWVEDRDGRKTGHSWHEVVLRRAGRSALGAAPVATEFVNEMRVAAAFLWYSHGELSLNRRPERSRARVARNDGEFEFLPQ